MSPAQSAPVPSTPAAAVYPELLRVLFLVDGLSERYADVSMADVIRHLNPHRFAAEVCSLGGLGREGEKLAGRFPMTANVRRHRYDVVTIRRLAGQWKHRTHVVVTLGQGDPLIWGWATARWAGTPAVVSILPDDPARPRLAAWQTLVASWSDALVADTERQRDRFKRYPGLSAERVHFIPWGVDTQRFCVDAASVFAARRRLRLPAGAPLFGLFTTETSDTSFRQLLDIARRVRFQIPAARFLWCGRRSLHSADEGLLSTYGLRDHLQTSLTDDPVQTLTGLTALCLLTDCDAPTPTLLQSMALRIPVVCNDRPGLRSLIQSDVTGCLAAESNPHTFASQLVRCAREPAVAHRLGAAARRQVIAHWSLAQTIRRYEQLLWETYQRKQFGPTQAERLTDGVELCGASP